MWFCTRKYNKCSHTMIKTTDPNMMPDEKLSGIHIITIFVAPKFEFIEIPEHTGNNRNTLSYFIFVLLMPFLAYSKLLISV